MRTSTTTNLFLLASAIIVSSARAAVHYVDVNSTNPVPPYISWDTAAVTIQDAENVCLIGNGDEILVTNGVYATGATLSARVSISRARYVHSVNGPEVTIVQGYQPPGTTNGAGSIRCFSANNTTIAGFTLINGAASDFGGGLYSSGASAPATASNCVFVGNVAVLGGATYGAIMFDCQILGNIARTSGGGCFSSRLVNCAISNNIAGTGGGCYASTSINCILFGNAAVTGGGAYGGALNNCIVASNRVSGLGGAAGGGTANCNLTNCLVIGNTSTFRGGGAYAGYLVNCTVISNSASSSAGGFYPVAPGSEPTAKNTILYFNSAPDGPNFADIGFLSACCIPELTSHSQYAVTNPPLFLAPTSGDFRLHPLSPCVNSGRNAGIQNDTDLGGNPRIAAGTVDIGAYEFQNPVSVISYAWLQNYGLPTDGSADFADSDSDGMNNWQEWVTNTDPTNSLSYLHMLAPDGTNNAAGVTIHWQSAGLAYFLQRSTNLAGPFTTFATNFFAGIGIATYRDATATNSGTYFYRVGVQP